MMKLQSMINRVLFVASFALVLLAAWEKSANFFGYVTVVRSYYEPARLLELAAIALLFVIALLLRDIQHALTGKGGA